MTEKKTGLELLRAPFPDNQIGKLPKGTKKQNQCDDKDKINCTVCGGWHHPRVIHLDYVGHAALTDRLLDADLKWNWEPLAYTELGLPAYDTEGGLWIKLTVLDVTRIGYGNAVKASFKDIGSREKEVIGDALRNAAMRFGAALDLWHKGDLHDDIEEDEPKKKEKLKGPLQRTALKAQLNLYLRAILASTSMEEFEQAAVDYKAPLEQAKEQWAEFFTDQSAEPNFPTFKEQVTKKLASIKREEGVYKQQQKDLGEGDEDFVNPFQ